MQVITNILSIDPSIRNIGYSLLQINSKVSVRRLVEGTYHPSEKDNLMGICDNTYKKICRDIGIFTVNFLVMEYPQFMQGAKGNIAAQKGYTIDIATVVGFLAGRFNLGQYRTYVYTPVEWKGQMPKTATQAAYNRLFPKGGMKSTEHSVDATMLGIYFAKRSSLLQDCN